MRSMNLNQLGTLVAGLDPGFAVLLIGRLFDSSGRTVVLIITTLGAGCVALLLFI
ncbi:hypothetical protein [Paenibacillus pedocola]|uniref:hypothetical protein n=1 Tax=Paenibacillus pedocola TaxID=3242193 RepID=UPI002877B327|nr:hypothetical protein [Paenibacillus typhae]